MMKNRCFIYSVITLIIACSLLSCKSKQKYNDLRHGDNWIFFKNAYLSYDGNTYDIYFDEYQDKETEVGSGVSEWIDVSVSSSTLDFLKQMVNGKNIKMRLSGKYTRTRDLSTNEIKGIKDVLLAYDVLVNEDKKLLY